MGTLLLLARLLLAVVFAGAGLAKLADPEGSRRSFRAFGVPGALAAPLVLMLPVAELAVAFALIPRASAWWAGVAALLLLLLFIGVIGANLARGRKPDCHCFGQLSSGAIGWQTLLRNAALALVAGLLVSQGRTDAGRSAVAWIGDLSTAERSWLVIGAAALALLAGEAWILLQLLAQNGRLLVRLESLETRLATGGVPAAPTLQIDGEEPSVGLPVGTTAPPFSLSGIHGETMTLDALRAAGRPVLLIFSDPQCGPCAALLPELGRWQRELATVTLTVISRGTPQENRDKAGQHGLSRVLLQGDREVAEAYGVVGTPSAVLVRPDGTIGSATAQGAEEIGALVARLAAGGPVDALLTVLSPADNGSGPCPHCGKAHSNGATAAPAPATPAGLPLGTPMPALQLPDLDGDTVDLADYRGRETVLLFWNPGCGYCQQMLPDLKAWEANRPENAPAVLVVASGTPDALRDQGLASTVLLDPGFTVGPSVGANGTPMAIVVDAAGKVASTPAAGADAVFTLLNGRAAHR